MGRFQNGRVGERGGNEEEERRENIWAVPRRLLPPGPLKKKPSK